MNSQESKIYFDRYRITCMYIYDSYLEIIPMKLPLVSEGLFTLK